MTTEFDVVSSIKVQLDEIYKELIRLNIRVDLLQEQIIELRHEYKNHD